MTTSVADKTPIPEKVWRRHTDPPNLWIALGISSVALHLLAFWLMRSYFFKLWFPQQSQAIVPIEVVEISPQAKSRPITKPVAPKPVSKTQNLQATQLPKQVTPINKSTIKPAVSNISDPSTIALASQKRAIARQRQQQAEQQRQQQLEQQRQQAEQQRQQQAEQQRQQQAEQQRQQQAEQQRQQAEQQRQQQAEQRQEEPVGEKLSPPKTQSQGGLFAFWIPVSEEEQRAQMREPLPKELKLAEHIGSNEKEVASIYINSNLDLPAVEFLVSLIIDKTGKFMEAKVIDPAIPAAEKSKYEQFANDVFQGEKFQPAHYTDGTKPPPDLSNRFVRLKIERR
ncbi:hypothetical protein I8752_33625 [Nostocaceae cyanobacterium CENA369]|uniref:Uncharacterized protein n=1 Tax=Dendronalium phyllosphericum CENA369 TaxID=1725256 RepID=A0A8J7IUG3_9NOST|nr:hypothetical protein [Dendronalium phyllosphericum]MBH8577817.1 hypothetical protein [Dendronalium phyllosphericum CENA369]